MLSPALVSPFAMLLNPEIVLQAMEHSERLNHLHSRVYRPLDKPLIPRGAVVDLTEFDRLVDAEDLDEVELEDSLLS
ncbi:hypothetical protein [Roseateles koreensis]|uniref:Uncharacterized protein n=1 Tax=Roseateles koreensis TaxID=2987526 RepID=A0ABT5KTA9_9BURK|nr:hypothetical protein [Roseateles koreensis]MDC8786150.1 hypothetical protein [Roseateles koreensis]